MFATWITHAGRFLFTRILDRLWTFDSEEGGVGFRPHSSALLIVGIVFPFPKVFHVYACTMADGFLFFQLKKIFVCDVTFLKFPYL